MLKYILTSTLLFTLFALPAKGQKTITLQEAISTALENNYQLKKTQNNLDLAGENVTNAKWDFLPSVNASTGYNYTVGRQFIQETVSFEDRTVNSISGQIGANMTIFDGLRNIYTLRQAETNKKSIEEQFQRARQDLIFNVASQYLQLLLDQELLEISRENLEASRKQLEQVQAQVEVGSRPVADLYNQESVVANNELSVIQNENQFDLNKQSLIRTLQIDPLAEYTFERPELDEDIDFATYNLRTLVETALSNRSDVKSQEFNIQASKLGYKIAQSGYYPSLSFRAGFSSNYNDQYRIPDPAAGGLVSVSFGDQFLDQNINRFMGLSLNIPILNNYDVKYSVESSFVNYKNAQLDLENTRLQVVQEIRQAYNDYMNYVKQLESTEKALRAAEKALETQQERYNIGSSTLIELTQANSDFVEASSNRVQAMYRLVFQEQLLKYYMGQITTNVDLN